MKRERYTGEQIAYCLRQAEAGTSVTEPRQGSVLDGMQPVAL